MKKSNSKDLWLEIEKTMPNDSFVLGRYTTQGYYDDPVCLVFMAARYKFCARMLSGLKTVLEIGCGDGFGGAIVAQGVKKLICTDINKALLENNKTRNKYFSNIEYRYHNFSEKPYPDKVDGIFLVDVIEHIFENEESNFLSNIIASLNDNGVCLIGTPNLTADKYASKYSKAAHVNLKDYKALRSIGKKYFNNSFLFGMNDEMVHTGFPKMSHYLWILCTGPKELI